MSPVHTSQPQVTLPCMDPNHGFRPLLRPRMHGRPGLYSGSWGRGRAGGRGHTSQKLAEYLVWFWSSTSQPPCSESSSIRPSANIE